MLKIAVLVITTLLFCQGNVSCYDYEENLKEIIKFINDALNFYRNTTLMNFHTNIAQSVKMQFDSVATLAAISENPYAYAHVITFRKNYTAVPYLLDSMINDTRDSIVETFDYQRREYTNVVLHVRKSSADVYNILNQKLCNETIMKEFFNHLFFNVSERVSMSISEGYSAYTSQLMNHYTPFMLFSSYTMQLSSCINNIAMDALSDTTFCMVQKDDLYLSPTISLISESLKSVESLIENFNLKLTGYVVKDVEDTFNRAYKDALLLKC